METYGAPMMRELVLIAQGLGIKSYGQQRHNYQVMAGCVGW